LSLKLVKEDGDAFAFELMRHRPSHESREPARTNTFANRGGEFARDADGKLGSR
jgi:hypothetical protein